MGFLYILCFQKCIFHNLQRLVLFVDVNGSCTGSLSEWNSVYVCIVTYGELAASSQILCTRSHLHIIHIILSHCNIQLKLKFGGINRKKWHFFSSYKLTASQPHQHLKIQISHKNKYHGCFINNTIKWGRRWGNLVKFFPTRFTDAMILGNLGKLI